MVHVATLTNIPKRRKVRNPLPLTIKRFSDLYLFQEILLLFLANFC